MNDEPTSQPEGHALSPDARRALHAANPDAVVYFAADRTIRYFNRRAEELFGLHDGLIGEDIYKLRENEYEALDVDLIHASDHFHKSKRTLDEGVETRSELVLIDGDERRELEVVWAPVRRDGRTVGVVGNYRDVSERPTLTDQFAYETRQAEEDRQLLASIVDTVDIGILLVDEHGTVELANRTARFLIGVDSPLEGLDVEELAGASRLEAPGKLSEQLRRTRDEGRGFADIYWLNPPDVDAEETEALSIRSRPLGESREQLLLTVHPRSFAHVVDRAELLRALPSITDRRSSFDEAAEDVVKTLTRHLPVDFAVLTNRTDEGFQPVAWRGVMLDDDSIFGASEHPSLEHVLESDAARRFDVLPWKHDPDADGNVLQWVLPLKLRGSAVGTLHLGLLADQATTDFRSAFPLEDAAFYDALAGILTAILGRVRAEDDRQRTIERLEAVFETMPEGLLLYDRRGTVHYANHRVHELTEIDEWSNLNTESRPYRIRRPNGEALPRSEWPFFRAVRLDEPVEEELVLDFGDQRRTLLVGGLPVPGSDDLFVGLMRDITERQNIERRRDEFLSIASHELRNPLTPLTGILQLARRQCERGEDVDLSLLTRAERQVTRLTRLLDGLLDLTRIETGQFDLDPREVELGSFLENRLEPWVIHDDDVDIELETPESETWANVDPDRLEQVLTNVVDNAVEYSNADSPIRVELREDTDGVHLAVEDDGIGMDAETVEHVFDRFYHAAEARGERQSMGLGLYICRQIVEQHGGTIDIETSPGEGTRVDIVLPPEPTDVDD